MEWMLLPLRRYAEFSGRSRRKEYWMFALLVFLVYAVGGAMIFSAIWPALTEGVPTSPFDQLNAIGWLGITVLGLFTLAIFIPGIAVTVRRFHDRDMSGWWYLGFVIAGQIPKIGGLFSLAMLVLMALPGTPGPNRFGNDPKDPLDTEAFA